MHPNTPAANSPAIPPDALALLAHLIEHPHQTLGYDFRVKALDETGLIGWVAGLGYGPTPKGIDYAAAQAVQS